MTAGNIAFNGRALGFLKVLLIGHTVAAIAVGIIFGIRTNYFLFDVADSFLFTKMLPVALAVFFDDIVLHSFLNVFFFLGSTIVATLLVFGGPWRRGEARWMSMFLLTGLWLAIGWVTAGELLLLAMVQGPIAGFAFVEAVWRLAPARETGGA